MDKSISVEVSEKEEYVGIQEFKDFKSKMEKTVDSILRNQEEGKYRIDDMQNDVHQFSYRIDDVQTSIDKIGYDTGVNSRVVESLLMSTARIEQLLENVLNNQGKEELGMPIIIEEKDQAMQTSLAEDSLVDRSRAVNSTPDDSKISSNIKDHINKVIDEKLGSTMKEMVDINLEGKMRYDLVREMVDSLRSDTQNTFFATSDNQAELELNFSKEISRLDAIIIGERERSSVSKSQSTDTPENVIGGGLHELQRENIRQDEPAIDPTTPFVMTCSFQGDRIARAESRRTDDPHVTGCFSCSVHLLCYVRVGDSYKFAFKIRHEESRIFPGCIDFTASGYRLTPLDSSTKAMRKVIRKELDIVVDERKLINMHLLSWEPYDDGKGRNLRYSKGDLYFCLLKDLDLDVRDFLLVDINKVLQVDLDYKPDLKALWLDGKSMNKILSTIYSKVEREDSPDEFEDEIVLNPKRFVDNSFIRNPAAFPTRESNVFSSSVIRDIPSRNGSPHVTNSISSSANFSGRRVNFNEDLSMEAMNARRTASIRRSDRLEPDRSIGNNIDRARNFNIPNDRMENNVGWNQTEANRMYLVPAPTDKLKKLSEITLESVLKFMYQVNEYQKVSKVVVLYSEYMKDVVIEQLEEVARTAYLESGLKILPNDDFNIRNKGTQVCFNDHILKLLAYELRPQSYQEMLEGLALKVWPNTEVDFTDSKNYEKHFPKFLQAVYNYNKRYREKLNLLIFYDESLQFYPENVWPQASRSGQISYYMNGFPEPSILKKLNLNIPFSDMKSIKTLDEYINTIMVVFRNANNHYKRDRETFNNIFQGKEKGKYIAGKDSDKKPYYNRFKTKSKNQRINNIEEDNDQYQDDDDETDIRDIYSDPEPHDPDDNISVSSESDVSDKEESDSYIDEDQAESEVNNTIQGKHKSSLQVEGKNVCFEMVNKGICKKTNCEYSHDKSLIEQFKKNAVEAKARKMKILSSNSKGVSNSKPSAQRVK